MQKRTRFKSRIHDVLVVLFCLLIAGFFLHLFWQDLNAFTTRNDKSKIGVVSFKEKIAQRKFDDRVVWERVAKNTELYYGDTIRTSDFAQMTITFKDDTTLDLYENTMVQVFWTEENGLQINVSSGNVQVNTATSRTARTANGVSIRLADGLQVAMDAGSALAVKA
ncbi:MAG: FecR domain-containing protein, partial [Clostridiales bacterium]|nr:FecR domain-containing protein [Clostridiales bacterium]